MARHRGVRNRQFSYDEGDEDYYDEEEEDRLVEEHRLRMLQARGDTADVSSNSRGGGGGGGISLSSYFDDLPGSAPRQQQRQQRAYDGREPPGHSDRHAPDKPPQPGGDDEAADAELVAAIAAELESRLGAGRFSSEQVRLAVRTSEYEVDTAEVILLSASEASSEPQVQFGGGNSNSSHRTVTAATTAVVPPPPGLPPDATVTTAVPAAASAAAAAAAVGVQRFDFGTPSPDDLNLSKQAAARGGGGAGGRKIDNFSSQKAKVVHISDTAPKSTAAGRQSITGTPTAAAATRTPTKTRVQSPTGGGISAPSPQQSAAAAAAMDESDDAQAGGKERLAMVVIGHVDAGKSTLMGQVLVQMGQVTQRALHKQEKEAREAGKASFFLAWVMDEDQEERAHGVTIEVAQKHIETETKLVTLLDAPGHRDFIPKMISGASAADAAVLVVPAAVGEFESGFQANGQTKEHAMLAKALGVNQLLVVVNKLDATDPPWSEARYEAVKAEVGPFLARTGFRPKKVRFLPASGLSAENVSKRTEGGALSSWYDGPTLLEAIDSFQAAPRAIDKAFRMCVADVTSSGKGVSVSGRVVQGRLRSGDKVVVMPLEDPAAAARLERNGAPARTARAGDNAEVTLSGVDPSRVVVGNVMCMAGGVLPAVRRFNAQIVALPALEVPIIKGTEFQLHMHNLDVMVHCSKLVSLTNTAGTVLKARPRCVPTGSTAHIRITCQRPICLEKYGDCRALGRFVLRQKGATVAVGLVLDTEIR
ncbi:unnamed protein product [Ectocarpus sp. CCAP 1310/34]|nr:unnamed protein product [Ectocarpus sp. CCAP 1310/34]